MRLKARREAKGISQIALSTLTGIPQTYLSLAESGNKDLPIEDMSALEAQLGEIEWEDQFSVNDKISVFQAMFALSENYPLLSVLEFVKKTLQDRRDTDPLTKLQNYAAQTQVEGLYPPGVEVEGEGE
jgi:transcriptional regulator with XRE-family HTH domain